MPYSADNPGEFVSIFKTLMAKKGLSPSAAAALVKEHRTRIGQPGPGFAPISRTTLMRFLKDQSGGKASALNELWMVLERNPYYAEAFVKSNEPYGAMHPTNAMAIGIKSFFTDCQSQQRVVNIAILRRRLEGTYVMYRPGWSVNGRTGLVMRSELRIVDTEHAASVFEKQKQVHSEIEDYEQDDSGFLFAFSPHLYFIMREGPGGTAVKMGVIEKVFPENDGKYITHFQGVLFVSSHIRIYPAVSFWCHRLGGEHKLSPKQTDLRQIPQLPREYISDSVNGIDPTALTLNQKRS